MNNSYYFLYYFFDNPVIRWIRVIIFFTIGFVVYFNLKNSQFVIQLLPLYFLLILQEFFIHFRLENGKPSKKVSEEAMHPIECVDFKTRSHLERNAKIEKAIEQTTFESSVRYFNKLLDFKYPKNTVEITEEDILKKAKEIIASVSGIYIHAVDIYASYILLLDQQTKILFQNDINEKDVVVVLSWVRKQFGIDVPKRNGLTFTGNGVFDFFVYGWSAELARYASNFTSEVLSRNQITAIGRSQEYDLLVTALSKNSASNALIIGKAGIGKETLVSQFVMDSNMGVLPKTVSNKIVFKLFPERLLAGINNLGDFEQRFISLFSELSHAGNIVVYIPNIENIFGGGGMNTDISGVLVEYLKSSNIKIIGSTTDDAFQTYIYAKQEMKELFDNIVLNEPDLETVIFMIFEKAKELENLNNVTICYSAIKESHALSDTYINDGAALPGRAIRLLDDTISFAKTHDITKITKKQIQDLVQEKTHILLAEPGEDESNKLLNLESEIHKRIVSQDEAVKAISDAMRRVRSGMKSDKKPIASFLFLGPTGVGKTETAKALAATYFGDEKAMIRLDMSEYQSPDSIERFLGSTQQHEETILDKVLTNPFSLILLDEFEKAYPKILDLFLQVLDDGRLTDNIGRTASFNNTIIIATSNAGSEFIREQFVKNLSSSKLKQQLLEKIQNTNIYKPELLNRFDDVIVFNPLSEKDIYTVAKLFLQEVIEKIAEQQVTLTYENAVLEFIASHAFSIEFGARNVKRFIEQTIENQLSKLLLSKLLQRGGNAKIIVENNSLVIKV